MIKSSIDNIFCIPSNPTTALLYGWFDKLPKSSYEWPKVTKSYLYGNKSKQNWIKVGFNNYVYKCCDTKQCPSFKKIIRLCEKGIINSSIIHNLTIDNVDNIEYIERCHFDNVSLCNKNLNIKIFESDLRNVSFYDKNCKRSSIEIIDFELNNVNMTVYNNQRSFLNTVKHLTYDNTSSIRYDMSLISGLNRGILFEIPNFIFINDHRYTYRLSDDDLSFRWVFGNNKRDINQYKDFTELIKLKHKAWDFIKNLD